MEERVIDLLTIEEKAKYYELTTKIERNKQNLDLEEFKILYRQASKILLSAVDREIERRKKQKENE